MVADPRRPAEVYAESGGGMSDITRQQLCAALGISESTVRRLELDGLPFTPIGRRACQSAARVSTHSSGTFPSRASQVATSKPGQVLCTSGRSRWPRIFAPG